MRRGRSEKDMRRLMKLSAWTCLISSFVLAIANAMEMCSEGGMAVVASLAFEALGIVCLMISYGEN